LILINEIIVEQIFRNVVRICTLKSKDVLIVLWSEPNIGASTSLLITCPGEFVHTRSKQDFDVGVMRVGELINSVNLCLTVTSYSLLPSGELASSLHHILLLELKSPPKITTSELILGTVYMLSRDIKKLIVSVYFRVHPI
jgi:hypothetical protein